MNIHRVMILDAVHPLLPERLQESGLCEVLDGSEADPEEILKALGRTDLAVHGLVIRSKMKLNAAALSRAVNLRWIARAGSGCDGIDTDFASKNNIALIHASEGNRLAVAEHVLAMILAWLNRLNQGNQEIRQGIWNREGNRGRQLAGSVVGLIGYGHNGSQTARLLAAMGCKVLVYDKYQHGYASTAQPLVIESTMEEIYNEAQILTLHAPLTDQTRNLVQGDYLRRFRHLKLLVNAARGPMVNLPDLVQALEQNILEGACLDTLPIENPQNWDHLWMDRLLAHPRVMVSPHVAGWTVESYKAISEVLADKIIAHLQQPTKPTNEANSRS